MDRRTSVLLLCVAAGCDGNAVALVAGDTAMPVAIDFGPRPGSPATYKGLPLALATTGSPTVTAVDGVIGIVCIGMSNGNQECAELQARVSGEYALAIDPSVRVVNCAVGGHAIERWNAPEYDDMLWRRCIEERLPERGVRLDQVRVIWHKAANQFTTLGGNVKPPYPDADSDYHAFFENLSRFAARVQPWFPAVQAVYTSSRSYGGFANTPGRGEPLSYEEGHALNTWLATNPSVAGTWYGWGPYLWAPDCSTRAVNGSGVCYSRGDYVEDGVHPAATGRAKISALLHARFLADNWYRRD